MVITTQCNMPQKATRFSSLFPKATPQTPEVSFIAFEFFWSPDWLDALRTDFHLDQTWRAGDTHAKLVEQPHGKAFSRQEEVECLIQNNAQLPPERDKYPLWKRTWLKVAVLRTQTDTPRFHSDELKERRVVVTLWNTAENKTVLSDLSTFTLDFCNP